MVRGNPAALLWINHKAKKIWKKYGGKEGKYKKAHKEALPLIARNILRRKNELICDVLFFLCIYQGQHTYI